MSKISAYLSGSFGLQNCLNNFNCSVDYFSPGRNLLNSFCNLWKTASHKQHSQCSNCIGRELLQLICPFPKLRGTDGWKFWHKLSPLLAGSTTSRKQFGDRFPLSILTLRAIWRWRISHTWLTEGCSVQYVRRVISAKFSKNGRNYFSSRWNLPAATCMVKKGGPETQPASRSGSSSPVAQWSTLHKN